MSEFSFEKLAEIIAERAGSDDGGSYTAKLAKAGMSKCAQKLGEEAVEAAIAAVEGDSDGNWGNLKNEAADLIYHLFVVLQVAGIPLQAVKDELASRTGQTGLEEKASRQDAS